MQRLKVLAGVLTLALLLPAGAAFAQVDTGSANFTRYVAFGDSLTAGFSSAALVQTFQKNSYPILIFRQATGRTTGFEQPLVSEPGFSSAAHFGILRLVSLVPGPVIAPTPGDAVPLNLTAPAYNNIAVPGARLHDLLATTSGGLHNLILRGGPPQLQQGLALQPTFATLWIGNNDVLAAATSGIVIDGVTLTTAEQFDTEFRQAAAAIAGAGAKMAIANIPNVTSIPFVTTISRTQRLPTGQTVTLFGPNGQLQAGDFVLLSASADIANGRGFSPANPLADSQVLSAAEVATIQDRINHYNATISAVASDRGAALVDTNAALRQLSTTGISVGGVTYTSAFLTGGIFSYDGVHPTAFGYAYIANLFIDAINDKFGGDIEPVNLLPFVFGTAKRAATGKSVFGDAGQVDFVFTNEARRNLLLSLGVPKWIVDNQPAPSNKPPRRRGGKH
ncbi:MAG TPA: SGNH/GDSL hydrolase family protein [Thermoanaerobaculia bacterium]|jgi:lysophospholipase L1-like esterase|nr:SGNH/GDSL hydrolase family protein [Thermoanaerobaculia bacterium]